jgi:hypothetical protein
VCLCVPLSLLGNGVPSSARQGSVFQRRRSDWAEQRTCSSSDGDSRLSVLNIYLIYRGGPKREHLRSDSYLSTFGDNQFGVAAALSVCRSGQVGLAAALGNWYRNGLHRKRTAQSRKNKLIKYYLKFIRNLFPKFSLSDSREFTFVILFETSSAYNIFLEDV